MHEFSLMEEVLRAVQDSAREEDVRRIHRVQMTVGAMGCAFPPALETAFSVLTEGDPLFQGAALEIVERAVRVRCATCGWEAIGRDARFVCEECGSSEVEILAGEELTVDGYEGE